MPKSQREAAVAFGMMGRQRFQQVILPQAFSYVIPAYANEVVFQVQSTALVSLVTPSDVTGCATVIGNRTFVQYEMYVSAAMAYLVLVYGILALVRLLERRLRRHTLRV